MRNKTRMQSFLMAMGAIFCVLLLAVAATALGLFIHGKMMDSQSANYAEKAMQDITGKWEVDELLKRAHPSMTVNTKPDAYADLFAKIRPIGTMKNFDGCEGTSNFNYTMGKGMVYGATYACKAQYENAPAILTFALIRENEWQIRAINIDSPFFTAQPAGAQ